jgi:hypothetical protein
LSRAVAAILVLDKLFVLGCGGNDTH